MADTNIPLPDDEPGAPQPAIPAPSQPVTPAPQPTYERPRRKSVWKPVGCAILGFAGLTAIAAWLIDRLPASPFRQGGTQQQGTQQQQGAPAATDETLTRARLALMEVSRDKKYAVEEISTVIDAYQRIKAHQLPANASTELKGLHTQVIGEHEKLINDAFNEADIYAYIGVVTDKASGNRRGNYGGTKPLYVGKGKDVADLFSVEQKGELVKKARREWKPYQEQRDVIPVEAVYASSIGVESGLFGKIVAKRKALGKKDDASAHYLTEATWAGLNDGKTDYNAEVRDSHLRCGAVYAGHAEPQ